MDGELAFVPDHVAGSSAVMQLMMACLALAAQMIRQQQHGLAAAAAGSAGASAQQQQQQQVAVPAYHQQLLDALGVAGAEGLPLDNSAAPVEAMLWRALCGVRCVRFQRPQSSSSSSAATAGQQQQQAGAAVDASLLAPLLFALLECCALLLPADQATAVACLTTMQQILTDWWDISESLARDLPPAMLQLLLPAIRAAAAAAEAGAAATAAPAAARAEAGGLAGHVSQVLLALGECVMSTAKKQRGDDDWPSDSTARALAAAVLEQPQRWCAVIEAGLRGRPPAQDVVHRVFGSGQVRWLLAATTAYASSESISLAAGEQQQVFALLISCLKEREKTAAAALAEVATRAGAAAADAFAGVRINVMLRLVEVARQACGLLMPRDDGGNTNSSSSQEGGSAAAAAGAAVGPSSQMAAHLLGRCLVAAGRAVQPALALEPQIKALMPLLADVAQQLQLLSPSSVPQQVVQQLLGEQAVLQQHVQALPDQPAAAVGTDDHQSAAAASSALGQQLEAFGAAVCAQAPVVHCCNHHLCSDTSQRSELELVSGKSCVCGGCQAARYCSRECQVAHYKSWHKAVCKRLQQQQA